MNNFFIFTVAIICCFNNVNGAYQLYSDEATFRAAISSLFLFEDFNGLLLDPSGTTVIADLGFAASITSDLSAAVCLGDVGSVFTATSVINLALSGDIAARAVGGYFFATDGNCDITASADLEIDIVFDGSVSVATFPVLADGNKNFWGIIADVAIIQLSLKCSILLPGLDDLIISTTPCGDKVISGNEECDSSSFCKADCTCQTNRLNCDGFNFNGCEIDKTHNKNNCGACGHACSDSHNQFRECMSSQCVPGICHDKFANCDNNNLNGCEVDLTNVHSCHTCNNDCESKPHVVSATCTNSVCKVTQCELNHGDCDTRGFNGCEILLNANPNHCGACGNVCSLPNATSQCQDGICKVKSCDAGYCNANHDPIDGCEKLCSH